MKNSTSSIPKKIELKELKWTSSFWQWESRPTYKFGDESEHFRGDCKYCRRLSQRAEGTHSCRVDKKSESRFTKITKIPSREGWSTWTSNKKRRSCNKQASTRNQHAVPWAQFLLSQNLQDALPARKNYPSAFTHRMLKLKWSPSWDCNHMPKRKVQLSMKKHCCTQASFRSS